MINLNETPEAILRLKQNDVVILDGHDFVFEEQGVGYGAPVFLSAVRAAEVVGPEKWAADYTGYGWVHLRLPTERDYLGDASMHRNEMIEAIKNKAYTLT